ncbi:MAG: M36 family metallopeptidase [Bryobacterales bacterium]
MAHAAYDGDANIHEYAHAVTDRLVGGPDTSTCLRGEIQSNAISEGVSDYFAASYFDDPRLGEYLRNEETGLRLAVMDNNPRTFESLGEPYFQSHADGEIIAAILWDIRKALGQAVADRSDRPMKPLPCEPTFVDFRDAMLAVGGEANRTALWRIFAPRGLGSSSRAENLGGGYDTLADAAFDLPSDLATGSNRPPTFLGGLSELILANENGIYTARATDPDGDPVTFRLLDGPDDAQLNTSTGRLTFRGKFTSQRVSIEASDGRGGRSVHTQLVFGGSLLTPGRAISIAGDRFSRGVGIVTITGARKPLQITTRGGSGDVNLTALASMMTSFT